MEIKGPEGIEASLWPGAEGDGTSQPVIHSGDHNGVILWPDRTYGTFRLNIQSARLDVTGTYTIRITPAQKVSSPR